MERSDRSFGERIRDVQIHPSRYERYAKIILRHSERPGEVDGESRRSVTRSEPNTAREASRCRSYAKPSQEHKRSAGRLEEGHCCGRKGLSSDWQEEATQYLSLLEKKSHDC